MPSFSQRTLSVSLSALLLIFLTAFVLAPRPDLNTLQIPSPFARCPPPPQKQRPLSPKHEPTWLIATISAYSSQRRRNIIRATWQSLYPNPAFSTRFVIAKPSALWHPLIKHENDTYGDLIILEHLEESAKIANTIKSVEFLKHVAAAPTAETPWEFVSKIDDDSFLSAERFYREFILPRLPSHRKTAAAPDDHNNNHNDDDNHDDTDNNNNNGTLIARRLLRPDRPFSTPGGQFYTLSINLVRLIASTHHKTPISDLPEDVLVGKLLYDANAQFEFVELDDERAFDVSDELGRLSKEKVDLGPMDGRALNPHKMKDDEMYLRVAALFGKEGFVGD